MSEEAWEAMLRNLSTEIVLENSRQAMKESRELINQINKNILEQQEFIGRQGF